MSESPASPSQPKTSPATMAVLSLLVAAAAVIIGVYFYPRIQERAQLAKRAAEAKRQAPIIRQQVELQVQLGNAASTGDVSKFAALVEQLRQLDTNPDRNFFAETGQAAVTRAVALRNVAIVEYWLDNKLPDRNERCPIVNEWLISLTASQNPTVDEEGKLLKDPASLEPRRIQLAKLLLKHGADPNAKNQYGFGPLHYEVQNGVAKSLAVARLLIEAGAIVDARPNFDSEYVPKPPPVDKTKPPQTLQTPPIPQEIFRPGWTPLMMAAKVGSEPLVKLLLSHQADPSITDSHGLTARDIAAKYKRDKIERLLHAASKS